jgi:hypothetical protein
MPYKAEKKGDKWVLYDTSKKKYVNKTFNTKASALSMAKTWSKPTVKNGGSWKTNLSNAAHAAAFFHTLHKATKLVDGGARIPRDRDDIRRRMVLLRLRTRMGIRYTVDDLRDILLVDGFNDEQIADIIAWYVQHLCNLDYRSYQSTSRFSDKWDRHGH